MTTTTKPIVVIGAGISGLTLAFLLKKKGIPVLVLEKDAEAGGTMKTVKEGGWLIETGPNSTLETTPIFKELFRDLGIESEVAYADPGGKIRFIIRDGKLHPLPTGPADFLLSNLWSLAGKLRLLKEPFVGRANREESIAEFVERRLGREFLDYAINPFVAGVYAGDPRSLSVRAAFPKLFALEEKYGGLIKGVIGGRRERKQRAEKAKDRAEMFSFRDGMETFPRAFQRALGNDLRLGVSVETIEKNSLGGWTVTYLENGLPSVVESSAIVLAVPAFVASDFLKQFSPQLASTLSAVVYPPVAEVFLGYKRSSVGRDLRGFGYLVPEVEGRGILGTIWSSSLFAGRTPSVDEVAFTSFVGGARQPELARRSVSEIAANVKSELAALMNISGEPIFEKVRVWENAIPQYNMGYQVVLDQLDAFEQSHQGFYFCANYRGGISVGDCVMSAEKLHNRIVESFS